jgi:hypothetical protein
MFATYTAFNGHCILPKLISTEDFYSFNVMPLYGVGSKNKNLAFRGKSTANAMLSRIDGVNNYLMYSDSVTQWDNPILLQEPRYSWEFTQIGNCGSQFGLQKDG